MVGFVLVAGCGGAFYLYQQLNGNISKVDVGVENDAVSDGPVNVLIIGTDARSGKGNPATATPAAWGTRTPRS